jgi:Domain of unknown function (DUF4296)
MPLLLCTLLVACTNSNGLPSNTIPPKQMKLIVWDLMRADEVINNYYTSDTLAGKQKRLELYSQAFKLHNITKDEFYKSYTAYQQHPDIQKDLFDSVFVLSQKREEIKVKIEDTLKRVVN